MPLIPALRRQKQVVDLYEYKASLVYKLSSRIDRARQRSWLEKQTNKQTNKTSYSTHFC